MTNRLPTLPHPFLNGDGSALLETAPGEKTGDAQARRLADATPDVETLLVDTEQAAKACGISPASWYRLKASGKTPAPIKLGGRVLYRLADLRSWVAMGCPPRKEFEARKAAMKT